MEKHYILKNILLSLIKNIKKQDFLVYFRKISLIESTETKLVLWVVSGFMKDNLEAKFYDDILKAAKTEIPTLERLEFNLDKNIENPSSTNSIDCGILFKEAWKKTTKIKDKNAVGETMREKKNVNSRYSLSNFIVGPDSQLAFSACDAVSKNPWKSYNPLYIYGDVWLWKTHLLQATW